MRRTTAKRWVPRRRAGEASGSCGGGGAAANRLSALPDALLHHVMSFLKAWEVVRTCMLSRRRRHHWASAPCVDLRTRYFRRNSEPPGGSAISYTASSSSARYQRRWTHHLQSSDTEDYSDSFNNDDANTWIKTAIKRNARVIHLTGHWNDNAVLEHRAFVSRHLKILKMSYVELDDKILRQLSSRCTSLEELDLKDCLVMGHEISSASLKTLTMVKRKINVDFSIAALNAVRLRIITPYIRVSSFKNLGSLVTGTIILDCSFLRDGFEQLSDVDDFDETTDDNGNNDRSKLGSPQKRYGLGGYKGGYGSDIESDNNTYGNDCNDCDDEKYVCHGDGHNSSKDGNYSDFGENYGCNDSKILGGHNVLHSLSNARSLELLTDAGEIQLSP